jgi:uncharacterized protein YegL
MLRRLPVYLLLDCSESMIGPPLKAMEDGVRAMVRTLMRNPYAMETLHMSVITFAATAAETVPLTELTSFITPVLSVRPGTALGAALKLCRERISRDVLVNTPERKGDFRPIVILMTDGEPTDRWRGHASELRDGTPKPAIIPVGCGEEADLSVLREISGGEAILVRDLTPEAIQSLFSWVSMSVGASSRAAGEGDVAVGAGSGGRISLEKAPLGKGLTLVKDGDALPPRPAPRMFLHVTCSTTRDRYLAVYRPRPSDGRLLPVGAHPLPPGFFADGDGAAPGASAGVTFAGHPICPLCGADSAINCGACSTMYCIRNDAKSFDCPGCNKVYGIAHVNGVEVNPSRG